MLQYFILVLSSLAVREHNHRVNVAYSSYLASEIVHTPVFTMFNYFVLRLGELMDGTWPCEFKAYDAIFVLLIRAPTPPSPTRPIARFWRGRGTSRAAQRGKGRVGGARVLWTASGALVEVEVVLQVELFGHHRGQAAGVDDKRAERVTAGISLL